MYLLWRRRLFQRVLNKRNVPYKQYHCLSFPSAHNSSLFHYYHCFILDLFSWACLSEKILFISFLICTYITKHVLCLDVRYHHEMQFYYCHLYSKQAGLIIRLSRRLKDSSLAANGVTSSHLDDHELHKSTGTRHGKKSPGVPLYRLLQARPHEINLL